MLEKRRFGSKGFGERSHVEIVSNHGALIPSGRGTSANPTPLARLVQVYKSARSSGHLERLRERLIESGPGGFLDCEMLELLLIRAVPERAVKPLVAQLIAAFGDYGGVISASPARLSDIEGMSAAAICELKLVEAAAHRLARARVLKRNALSSWDELINYCKTVLAYSQLEHFRVLFLDRKNFLIADEEHGRGTIDHVPVYPREVVKRALELNASAIILVHNHPSGDPAPSNADITMTRHIQTATKPVGVLVHDHVIVGRYSCTSFRSLGLL